MKLLTIHCSQGENHQAQMHESAHRSTEQPRWPGDKERATRVYQCFTKPADSYFCAKNSRTKHNVVKDAEVGKSLHSEKTWSAVVEREIQEGAACWVFLRLFAFGTWLQCLPNSSHHRTLALCLECPEWMAHSHKLRGWGTQCHCHGFL